MVMKKAVIFVILILSSLLLINYFYQVPEQTIEVLPYRARGGSMEPCIPDGTLLYGKLIFSPTELEIKDIVIYTDERTLELVGHELLGFNIEEDKYVVKGIANTQSEEIKFEDIRGILIREDGEKFKC